MLITSNGDIPLPVQYHGGIHCHQRGNGIGKAKPGIQAPSYGGKVPELSWAG
mgnify:CR=1 FL=1